MNEPQVPTEPSRAAGEILRDPEFQALIKRKSSLSLVLSLIVFGVYFGFMALLAFSPDTLKGHIGDATIGIPVGIGIIVLAWVLTGIYVRWANGAYDEMVARVKSKVAR